jgi:molecular chaperone IbpA
MRTALDFTPYRRSLIGFDSMFDQMETAARGEQLDPFPPYDIEQLGEDDYRIRVAVAGYSSEEVEVTTHGNLLVIAGRKDSEGEERKFLYRGIPSTGQFERRFQLAPHMLVVGANLADGILEIELKREIPEAAKPRKVEIGRKPAPKRMAKAQAAQPTNSAGQTKTPSAAGNQQRAEPQAA